MLQLYNDYALWLKIRLFPQSIEGHTALVEVRTETEPRQRVL